MLYWLTQFSDGGDVFNLFRYITFRAGGAFFTALAFGFIFGRPLIDTLRRRQGKGQPIRSDGPEGHFAKAGTPTMGGLLIVGALLTGVFASTQFGGSGLAEGMTVGSQVWAQAKSVLVTIAWSGVVSAVAFFLVDKLVGMRVPIEVERGGLDLAEHQEQAYEIV